MQIMARCFFALAQSLVQFSPWRNVKPLGHSLHKYRRWYNVVHRSGGLGNVLRELLNSLEAIKNRYVRTSSWWPLKWWNDASVTAEHHAWEFFNSYHVLLVLVSSRPANWDSLMELSQSSMSTLPAYRQVHNDGLDSVCQNSFLRCGQVNSVLCILLRSSMNLMVHLPRLLLLRWHSCRNKLYTTHCRGNVCLPSAIE